VILMAATPKPPCPHRLVVNTAKGRWLINVDRLWANMSDDSLSLKITVLNLTKDCIEFRALLAIVSREDLHLHLDAALLPTESRDRSRQATHGSRPSLAA